MNCEINAIMTDKGRIKESSVTQHDAASTASSKQQQQHEPKQRVGYTIVLPMLAASLVLAFVVFVLYLGASAPWPTIGVACLCHIYYCIHMLQRHKQRGGGATTTTTTTTTSSTNTTMKMDVQLSFFLASQLLLAYFSSYDPFKGPNGDSPFSASADYRHTNKHLRLHFAEFFTGESENVQWLERIEFACLFSWIFVLLTSFTEDKSAVFSGGTRRLVFSLLALSYVFLHGIMAGLNGVSHRFYVAAYCFVSLFLEANLGIDSHPFICLFCGYTFFSAGLSKLINSDFMWHDGQALCRFIGGDYRDEVMANFCATAATASTAFELMGPFLLLPIFGLLGRSIYTILALTFHLGIAMLMFPRYTSQSCAYILLFRTNPNNNNKPKGRLLFAVACFILILTMVFRIEFWPLTAVPMYSTNLPNEFGRTMEEAYHAARVVESSQCIADFGNEETSVHIVLKGGKCSNSNVWDIAGSLAKPKLIKLILIRGLASALVCQEQYQSDEYSSNNNTPCESSNYWFDKFSKAVYDECEPDRINYSLILQSNPRRYVQVYSWKSPTNQHDQETLEILAGQLQDATSPL
jgi:hypothetical protein